MLYSVDKAALYFFNHSISNSFFNFIMPMISEIGDGPLLFAASFILLFARKRELKVLGLILLAGLTINFYVVSGIKVLIARPRPFVVLPDVITFVKEKSMSFPSKHAATAFMAATVLTAYFKKYAALFFSFAAAIAISRVYMGVHYPSDVLAGALLGAVIGWLLLYINKAINSRSQ